MSKTIYATEVSKIIRGILKQNFPSIKFSVTTQNNSVIRITWKGGNITQEQVEKLVNGFKGKHYDGMYEVTSYSDTVYNGETVHFSVSGIYCSRHLTVEYLTQFADFISEHYHFKNPQTNETIKPLYKVKDSEYHGADIYNDNNAIFGNLYFDSVVYKLAHEYGSFEQFIKLEHGEYYSELFPTTEKEQTPQIEQMSNDGVKVELQGTWTWVTCSRDDVKTQDALRLLGFRFSGKRKQWYYAFDAVNEVKEALKTT